MGSVRRNLGAIGVNAAGGILATGFCAVLGLALSNIVSARAAIVATAATLTLVLWLISWYRYDLILGYGRSPKGSVNRRLHDALRDSLSGGAGIGDRYGRTLTTALARVDTLFGDAWRADRSWFWQAFGLRQPAPLWTAQSYDRCLLIALLYPIAILFCAWALTGAAGPAERAMGLEPGAAAWQRVIIFGACAICLALAVGTMRVQSCWQALALAILIGIVAFFVAREGPGPAALIAAVLGTLAALTVAGFAGFGLFLAYATASRMGAPAPKPGDNPFPEIRRAVTLDGAGPLALALAVAAAGLASGSLIVTVLGLAAVIPAAIVAFLNGLDMGARHSGLARFEILFSVAMLVAINLAALAAGTRFPAPLLLFIGVLTLVNAPFDWAMLGLTRALLRRGLERGGWWPLWYGIADLVAATLAVALLGVAILLAVQLFNALAVAGGGAAVLDVGGVLAALADPQGRRHPEHWWLYVMLFSTTVPSIANVAIGALSLLRGIPAIHRRIAVAMAEGKAIVASERIWMAPLLAGVDVLSWIAAPVVMAVILWLIFARLLPAVGIELLAMLQAIAAEDVPARLLHGIGLG